MTVSRLSSCRQAKAKSSAKRQNAQTTASNLARLQAVAAREEDVVSPWSLVRGSAEYMHPKDVERVNDRLGGVHKQAAKWTALMAQLVTADETFPAQVEYRKLIGSYVLALDAEQLANANKILTYLRWYLAPHGVNSSGALRPFMIVDTSSGAKRIVWSFAIRKSPEFSCCCLEYQGADSQPWPSDDIAIPCEARLAHGRVVKSIDLAIEVAQSGPGPFCMHTVSECPRRLSSLSRLWIESVGPAIDVEQLRAQNLASLKASRATKLWKLSLLSWKEQPRKRPSRRAAPPRAPGAAAVCAGAGEGGVADGAGGVVADDLVDLGAIGGMWVAEGTDDEKGQDDEILDKYEDKMHKTAGILGMHADKYDKTADKMDKTADKMGKTADKMDATVDEMDKTGDKLDKTADELDVDSIRLAIEDARARASLHTSCLL